MKETRKLKEVALEIRKDWKKPYFGAVPYLDAMLQLDSINDRYFFEDGRTQVIYFLSNAQTWRGERAREIKKYLKSIL
jgi:hypothetical protein